MPVLPHLGVCALVPDQWNNLWQPRQHVLARLAQYFQVIWVSPAPEWRRMFHRSAKQTSDKTDSISPSGLFVYEPACWPPKFYRPAWLSRVTFNLRVQRACRLLRSRGCEKLILYLWRPEFAPALASMPFDLTCYHIDDE
jgi:hypothetical protein